MADHRVRQQIRNFCIIAHIDHGKSTLADRMLELTATVDARQRREQLLDDMDLERERGITIKARTVRMRYEAADGTSYLLNLIDTPGHVDFSYEVSRSLAACEGAVLLVDATQGVQAQTVAHFYQAKEDGLTIIPAINKMDLPAADADRVRLELIELGIEPDDTLLLSAKDGSGVRDLLEAVVAQVPAPAAEPDAPLRALIFDSHFDRYRGAVAHVRLFDGAVEAGESIQLMSSGRRFEVTEVGVFRPHPDASQILRAGEVGYLAAGIKDVADCRVGDTITTSRRPAVQPLPGYRELKPMVFCGLYPVENDDHDDLRQALERLQLNDAALRYEPETSAALGFGFRCGFLGLLHMEIVQERLEREFGLALVTTAPSVVYRVTAADGEKLEIENPARFPERGDVESIAEPYVLAAVTTPEEFVGNVMELCEDRRGEYHALNYLDENRVRVEYEMPLAEIMYDFFDRLKSYTRGYGVLDYRPSGYRVSDLHKMEILVNKEPVDALSFIVHRDAAQARGRRLIQRLRQLIPRQLFKVPLQAALGSQVVAREDIPALRKDVLSKCYGGDVTRKRKLLERQKEGKKRMKQVGQVEIPQEAFMAVLEVDEHD